MSRPVLLDLFCGAGGCSMGYHRAGFDVVGVDINPQPNYPFEFHQADAMTFPLDGYDAVHASPPCQRYSAVTATHNANRVGHPDLLGPTRERLDACGLPWVVENVPGAPMRGDVVLCGSMFPGLGVKRHRLFDSNMPLGPAPTCRHDAMPKRFEVYRHGEVYLSRFAPVYGNGGGNASEHWAEAMGIDWMHRAELAQAIPPAYTEWIGRRLVAHVTADGVAA